MPLRAEAGPRLGDQVSTSARRIVPLGWGRFLRHTVTPAFLSAPFHLSLASVELLLALVLYQFWSLFPGLLQGSWNGASPAED